ncbi:MAG TPA: cytochrome b N-terminal domain-containing protein [Thermoleophilia bacterium]
MNLTRSAQRYLRLDFTLDDALPTRMPVYVNSVVYLFGATALMALAWIVISGVALTLGGPSWYHTNAVGRFANAVHFWSVQLFFFGLILHLITKFFLGAWRDGRWLTWVVGGLLLGIGVFTGLTGFLLQTNWDSQWIATQAKDAMNAAGIGAFFNTMNTGQVLTLHVAALPLGIAALLGLHIFLIRRDSPVRPYDDRPRRAPGGEAKTVAEAGAVAADSGDDELAGSGRRTRENLRAVPLKPYDLLREGLIVFGFAAVVVLALAIFVGAPDYPTVTGENVATKQPLVYAKTTVGILLGNDFSALGGYGPPYQNEASAAQHLGPIAPANWFGATRPIDPARDLVLAPLARVAQINPAYAQPLAAFAAATPTQQQSWLSAYDKALDTATVSGGAVHLPAGDYGPVEAMMNGMLSLGRAGLLEGALAAEGNGFAPYSFDFTKQLSYFAAAPPYFDTATHLVQQGNPQWGIVHETGNYPGAWWLDAYQVWYEIPAIGDADNADLLAVTIMTGLFVLLLLLPVIPGLNRLPHRLKVYRVIWRDWYRDHADGVTKERE